AQDTGCSDGYAPLCVLLEYEWSLCRLPAWAQPHDKPHFPAAAAKSAAESMRPAGYYQSATLCLAALPDAVSPVPDTAGTTPVPVPAAPAHGYPPSTPETDPPCLPARLLPVWDRCAR